MTARSLVLGAARWPIGHSPVVELGVHLAMPTSGSLAQGLAQAIADRGARR